MQSYDIDVKKKYEVSIFPTHSTSNHNNIYQDVYGMMIKRIEYHCNDKKNILKSRYHKHT